MKTKELIIVILALFVLFALASCDDDEGMTPNEEEEEEMTSAPESWVLVDTDSFFVASSTVLPTSSGPFRYQINFATRAQLDQTGNDGGTESTFAIGFAFESKPTTTGTFTFTSDRFNIAANELNLYQSFFTGKGHARDGNNYLSADDVTVSIDITDGVLTSDLISNTLTMTNEADENDSFELKWSLYLNW